MPLDNFKQAPGAVFKEAVLSKAETHGMHVIAEAGKKRAAALEQAYQQVARDATAGVEKRLRAEHDKELASLAGRAQRDLLLYRTELVDGMFARVEAQLEAFAAGEGYAPWCAAKLQAHAAQLDACETPVLSVRPADAARAELFQSRPDIRVEADNRIRLGGFLLACGNVLFDETFDAALAEERRAFYQSGVLALDALGGEAADATAEAGAAGVAAEAGSSISGQE